MINGASASDVIVDYGSNTLAAATAANIGTGWTVTNGVASKSGATLDDFIAGIGATAKAGTTSGVTNVAAGFVSGSDLYVYVAGADATLATDDFVVVVVGAASNTLTFNGDIVLT
jgi:hypothetical protein